MTLPPSIENSPQPAALVCPDCGGVISVRREGQQDYLLFSCQVGHAYSVATLIAGKEERLEEVLWSSVYLLEELARLLTGVADRAERETGQQPWAAAHRRLQQLQAHAQRVRLVLDETEPMTLGGNSE
jgi:two-component system, chemotaxis family, protein-glutamate methylesterase/glutaminase